MKKYNPIEELDNRLEALYPRKGGADIPKGVAGHFILMSTAWTSLVAAWR